MNTIHKHIVPEGLPPQRLSDYAPRVFYEFIPSKKGMKKAIKRGAVTIDGEAGSTGTWIKPGQEIALLEEEFSGAVLELPLEVVFEDEHLAVVNKPGGIPVSGNQFRTVQNALPFNLKRSGQKDRLILPRPVHRLDAPTCGLLLIAKTSRAAIELGRQLAEREVKKRYQAIAMGAVPDEGIFDEKIEDQAATTRFHCLDRRRSIKNEWISLVDLFPETGRTHQIRLHLAGAGFPILGDALYGKKGRVKKGKGLFLCAVELRFRHPVFSKAMNICIEPPPKFLKTMEREEKMWKKKNE